MRRLLLGLALVSSFALAGRAARASEDYPGVIATELALRAAPPCTLCHSSLSGGTGTVVTPFGLAMEGFGLTRKDPGSLRQALATSRARNTDSDGDGVPDIDELVAGTDPNDGPGRPNGIPPLEHGCSMTRAASASSGWMIAAIAAVASLGRRRRRRASRHASVRAPIAHL